MYDPFVEGRRLEFGVSGLLYRNTAILYDRHTESLWSQVSSRAISGQLKGAALPKAPFTDTTWGAWLEQHPDTLVLSTQTGYQRTYGLDPYVLNRSQGKDAPPGFPMDRLDRRLPLREMVYGVALHGAAKAYPIPALERLPRSFTDTIGQTPVHITNDPPGLRFEVRTASEELVPTMKLYWFVWAAFHPETSIAPSEGA